MTGEHVGARVSVRHLIEGPTGEPIPTDVVGRLLALDDEAMLLVDRESRLHVLEPSRVLASRVIPPHPRLPAEPDVGRSEGHPLLRRAARVLLLDPDDRVLLVSHAPDATRRVWTAPGGGLEPGETHEDGARREVREELGLEPAIGPWIFSRRVVFAFRSVWIDQDERWFLARCGSDDLIDASAAPLDDAGAVEARWWTLDELEDTSEALAPARLAEHLRRLLEEGPPPAPVDVGR